MKKLILLLLCMLLLSGCGRNESIYGEITAVYPVEASDRTEFLFRDTMRDLKIGLVITEETDIDSFGVDEQQIRNGEFSAAKVGVKYGRRLGKAAFDELVKLYEAEEITVHSVLAENEYTLSDGTEVDVWRDVFASYDIWQLRDGTELLHADELTGPARVSVIGVDASFDDLPLEAQERINDYYADQGLLYDLGAELEAAYTQWQEIENKELFSRRYVSQSISPVFANENVICFLTSGYGAGMGEIRLGAVFDRDTGEYIDVWELFSLSEEEVRKRIFAHSRVKLDPAVIDEMKVALRSEYILFYSDFLEINFPQDSLHESAMYNIVIDYSDIEYMLNDWAIPPQN